MTDNLRDLVVMTSYDKGTRLDVPVFLTENKTRRIGVAEVSAPALILPPSRERARSDFAAVCEAVARVMVRGARFEPSNTVAVHRSYPSPRGLFPVELDFVFTGGDRSVRFPYDAEHHALLVPHDTQAPLPDGPCALRLDVVAALNRIAPLYGDLAPTLCALEAGHVSYQLALALREAGIASHLRCAAAPQFDDDGVSDRGARSGFVAVEIELDGVRAVPPNPDTFTERVRIATPRLTAEDQARLDTSRDRLRCPPAAAKPISNPLGAAGDGDANGRGGVLRSSGNTLYGIFGEPVAEEDVDRLCAAIADDYRAGSYAESDPHLTLTLLRPQPNLDVTVTRAGADVPAATVAAGCVPLSEAYGSMYNIDLQTVPVIAVLSAPFGRVLARQSAWAYVQTLVVAGAVAQRMCNVAARRGYFARPFKGAVELLLETPFGIDGQAFYTVLMSKGGPANPAFSLEPMW